MSIVEHGNRRIDGFVKKKKENRKQTIELLMEEDNDRYERLWV